MNFLNSFIDQLKPYQVASHKVWEVSESERDMMLKLDWNEGTIAPSPRVKEELEILMMDETLYRLYPPTYSQRLMQLLSDYTKLPEENIQYFGSSDSLQEYVSRAVLDRGDVVLMVGPTYDNFRLSAEAQGAELVFFEMDAPFNMEVKALISAIEQIRDSGADGGRLKMVYVCNPNNPTGSSLSEQEVMQLVDAFPDVLFFVDEAYFEFNGSTVSKYVGDRNNLLVSRTFSKAFCLAGFRIGYLLGNSDLIVGISKIRNSKSITIFAQAAACAALEDLDYMQNYIHEVSKARDIFIDFLKSNSSKVTVFDSIGNFVLMRFCDAFEKEGTLAHLNDHDIYVRNLTHSRKLDNCLRISVGTVEQMERVILVMDSRWRSEL